MQAKDHQNVCILCMAQAFGIEMKTMKHGKLVKGKFFPNVFFKPFKF